MKTSKHTTLFYPLELFDTSSRWHIFPLLKSLLKEQDLKTKMFSIVNTIEEADCIILPMSWNYYYRFKRVKQVSEFYKTIPIEKKVLSFVFGDFGVKVPVFYKGIVIRTSGSRTKLSEKHQGSPVFIDDPLTKYYNREIPFNKPYSEKPIIGFCGQARSFGLHSIIEYIKTSIKNILSIIGYSKRGVEKLVSITFMRWKILNYLQISDKVETNFVFRSSYRAGVNEFKDNHKTTLEFYDNIKNSDYVLCVRGAGNFSTRFYETLAMGRIPVFVNTDCILPLVDKIDWKKHIVWLEYHEKHMIADKVKEFHSFHDESSLNNLFLENRKIWKDRLTVYSFFKSLLD